MTASYALGNADLASILPELALGGAGVLVLLLDAFVPRLKRLSTPLALAALGTAAYLAWTRVPEGSSFGGLLESTPVTVAIGGIVLLSALLSVLASHGYLRREGIFGGEYHALLLWCVAGLLFLARATELLSLFLALELLSICLYSLAGYHRRLAIATEGAIKYFLMGAFVSAFVLYGIALVYGETGSTRLPDVRSALQSPGEVSLLLTLGLLLLVAGFAFKMSLVPFHAWSPDTYQGAPSPFVIFLSVAPKAASAVVLIRLLEIVSGDAAGHRWPGLVALLAVLSMVVGNLLALVQQDIKRMLAYSGVAHMGYLLIPLASLDATSWEPVVVYLLAYALMNAGAFAVVSMLYSRAGEQHLISELSGWGYRFPLLGVCLTICMLSLGGIPPALGFLGKYLVFFHAIEHGQLWLAAVGVGTSLLGVFYYLRVVYTLYMQPETSAPQGLLIDFWGRGAALIAAVGSLALGIWPSTLLEWIRRAAAPGL
ncbi:MAG: NADH-quinone oxidoreductase subunit N [Thermoanaerobaculia bacterium]